MGKTPSPSPEKSNFELARFFLEDVWVRGNEETIFREFEGVATGLWPDEQGIDPHGFLQYQRALRPLIHDMQFEFIRHRESGPELYLSWVVHGRQWKNKDKVVRWPGAAFARFREGRVVEIENHHDFLLLFSQLDLVSQQAYEYYGLGGLDLFEAEAVRQEALPPSARNQTHFLWPGLRKVSSGGRELYLPCSAQPGCHVEAASDYSLPDEAQLEALFESSAYAMVSVDSADGILEADTAFSELVDRHPESLPGALFYQFVLPEDRGREREMFRQLVKGERGHYRHRLRLMRGRTVLWAVVATAAIPTSDGGSRIIRAVQECSRVEELVKFQENERKLLSVELHDGLAQEVATLWIHLQTSHLARSSTELRDRCLQVVERMGQELRRRMKELRSPVLEGALLSEALQGLAAQNEREKGLRIHLQLDAQLDQADHTVCLLVYRIVQEAARNVAQHAETSECRVMLERRGDQLVGRVADQGRGFETSTAKTTERMGLRGMTDRCELVGGQLSVRSRPGEGTTIAFELPWTPGASG